MPGIKGGSIKVYKGKYAGLIRAEFEFESEKEAKAFEKPDWVGTEISNSPLGRDSRLSNLCKEDFNRELGKYNL